MFIHARKHTRRPNAVSSDDNKLVGARCGWAELVVGGVGRKVVAITVVSCYRSLLTMAIRNTTLDVCFLVSR
jgi:hypothetical protein